MRNYITRQFSALLTPLTRPYMATGGGTCVCSSIERCYVDRLKYRDTVREDSPALTTKTQKKEGFLPPFLYSYPKRDLEDKT